MAPGAAGGEQVDAVAHQVDSQMDTGHPNNPGPGGEGDRHPTAHHVDSIDNDSRDPNVDLQMDIGHPKNPGPGGGGDRHPAAHHVRAPVIDVTEGPDPPGFHHPAQLLANVSGLLSPSTIPSVIA